jgi:GTP-dependent phosphoenolpyruvate carboxykinase
MLNVKEVTEQLKIEGITDSEEVVIRWILDGKIKAKRANHYKIDFSIKPGDLAAFILEKKIESKSKQFGVDYQQWEKTFGENQRLRERIVELESTVRIEQAKYSSLKKC